MEYGFEQCDILKISDNEIQFITGIEDYDQGVLYLQNKYEIPLILLTMGKKGSRAYYKDFRIEEKGFQVTFHENMQAAMTADEIVTEDLFATIDYNKRVRLEHAKENIAFEHAETQRMEA